MEDEVGESNMKSVGEWGMKSKLSVDMVFGTNRLTRGKSLLSVPKSSLRLLEWFTKDVVVSLDTGFLARLWIGSCKGASTLVDIVGC
jgi:hypothetical protein